MKIKKKKQKQIIIRKKKKFTQKIEKEKPHKNQKEKRIADPKQNELPLKSIVVYRNRNQNGDMELIKLCPNIKSKKSPNIFFNQRFVQQTSLLGIESVKKFAPKEWFNHLNGSDHPFQNKLKLAKNEAI